MLKLINAAVIAASILVSGYYANGYYRTQEQLCIINSLLDLADARIEKLTAVPHKGVRKHLRKDGEVK